MQNEMSGRVIEFVKGEGKRFHSLLIERDPLDKYEGDHPERLAVQIELSNYVYTKAPEPCFAPGAMITVKFRVNGNEYNGKHYVKIVADYITLDKAAGDPVVDKPFECEQADAKPETDDEMLPF